MNFTLMDFVDRIDEVGGRSFFVGGFVRDQMMGLDPKDIDIEVHGIEKDQLVSILSEFVDDIDMVGSSFAVFKVGDFDISLPRKDSKVGEGHKGFEVIHDPNMSFEDACGRRDLTINAIMRDTITGEIVDPFNGVEDLNRKILRHTTNRFMEDSLRVLRVAQFLSRFDGFTVHPDLINICKGLSWTELPKERIFEEVNKALLKGNKPSKFFEFLIEVEWTDLFPEIFDMMGVDQNPEWHPEGDVFNHTMKALDEWADKVRDKDNPDVIVVGWSILLHDLGKVSMTQIIDGVIRSPGHAKDSEVLAEKVLHKVTEEKDFIKKVKSLVVNHMKPGDFIRNNAKDSTFKRLATETDLILLAELHRADSLGSSGNGLSADLFLERVHKLDLTEKPKPIIMGRHLLDLGMKPSPRFGVILREMFDRQLEGEFNNVEKGTDILKAVIEEGF